MEWIRRRAKWPRLVALLLLFGLTLALPRCWDALRGSLRESGAPAPRTETETVAHADFARPTPSESVAAAEPTPAPDEQLLADVLGSAPELPPVVKPADQAPVDPIATTAPLLEDDYALVDEPLPAAADSAASQLSNQAESMASMAPLATASPRWPSEPGNDLRTPEPPPLPPTPARQRQLDLSSLLAARDALATLVDNLRAIELPELPQPTPQPTEPQPVAAAPQPEPVVQPTPAQAKATATPKLAPVQVKVEGPGDRLAMLPPKPATAPNPLRLIPPQAAQEPELAPPQPAPQAHAALSKPTTEVPRVAARSRRPAPPQRRPEPALLRIQPVALVHQLQEAAAPPLQAEWAERALTALEPLTTPDPSPEDAVAAVDQLERLARRGQEASLGVSDPGLQRTGLRAARSLHRRIALWRALADASRPASVWSTELGETAAEEALMPLLNEFAALTAGTDAGLAWRDYLALNDLAALASVGSADQTEQRREVARQVLARLESTELTNAQQAFLAATPAAELAAALRPWASGRVDVAVLAALVERYEYKGAQRDADLISELRMRLALSDQPHQRQLAAELDRYYRNGNMRLAVTGELLNRLTPQPEPTSSRVRDNVAGADVRGRAQTTTKLVVRLLPDEEVWRFGLEAHGNVRSQTYSDTWPAKVRNKAQIDYEARKLILVNQHGLHVWPAQARTGDNSNRLTGVDNSLDVVPLVGPLVEGYAKQQHRERRPRAMAQVKRKVSREARTRLDRETDAKLAAMEQKFTQAVMTPLEQLAVAVQPLEMYTTERRAVMRMRLAAAAQLGAHTPRPAAPGDSLASAQLHESALNNAARGLGLDGRTFTSLELYESLAAQLDRSLNPPEADFPSRATVTFAKSDAVRVRCDNDRVELILSIAELSQGRDRIADVEVHAFFRPVVDGLALKLVRDDTLQFNGRRLLTGARIVLHSVFGKMLPKDQEIVILAPRVEGDPRFAGLMVTQLVIEDGWLAMALGPQLPERTAWRSEAATPQR